MVIRSPCLNRHQELANPEQTAFGKDFSNPLMVDSLPKTIWFSTHRASQLKAKEFQDYKVTKELKFIKEKIKSSSVFGYIIQVFKKLTVFSRYGVLILDPLWYLVKYRHRYTVSSLMDTAYWMSEQ
ncbi:hypothetical protein Tco_0694090 [Tanacetum coccineum]